MIVLLQGTLLEAMPLSAVIDVQGIGYEVHTPITTTERLPNIGETVKLYTLAVYREDSQALYGFHNKEDREFFRLLVEKVSGIGPRIALNIMSRLSLPVLKNAIAQSDVALLSKCQGIGKKTAERLIIELRDKVFPGGVGMSSAAAPESTSQAPNTGESALLPDAVAALMTLGYKAADADKAARRSLTQLGDTATVESVIKKALN